jgi:hypothetical protein
VSSGIQTDIAAGIVVDDGVEARGAILDRQASGLSDVGDVDERPDA